MGYFPRTGPSGFRTVSRRLAGTILVVAVAVLLGPGATGLLSLQSGSSAGSPVAGHVATLSTSTPHPGTTSRPISRSSAPLNVSPLFFSNDWSAGNVSTANVTCNSPSGWCYPMSQNPSLLSLANGDLGLAFSAITNFTSAPACSNAANTSSRIAWSTSSDGGTSFAPFQFIGNNGTAGCPYYEGIEPSFTVSSTGEIFGAFVATNATAGQMFNSGALGAYGSGRPVLDYLYRPYSALALITSTDNGSTWSATRLIVNTGEIAMPRIASFGRSVYIVYTNITNSTGAIPGASTDATSLEFVASANAGSTWTGPSNVPAWLPDSNATQDNNAMDPSISINPAGEIALAFAANRSCFALCSTFNSAFADDIVVSLSTTNGSTWSRPSVASRNASEFGYGSPNFGGPGLWEGAIDTTVEWGSNTSLYVAWSQSEDMNLTDQYALELDFANSGIFSAASSDGGHTWATASVTGALPALDYNQEVFGFGYFNPALGVHDGTVYLAYSFYNWTNGGTGYHAFLQDAYGDGNGEWLATSSNGVTWNSPSIIVMDPAGTGITDFDYWGYLGSIAFDSSGNPVVAYALQTAFISFTTTLNLPVALMVATIYSGPTTTVTIEETGLPSGTRWNAEISGEIVSTTQSEFNVTDAPVGQSFYVVWPGPVVFTAYRTAMMPVIGEAPIFVATGPTTDLFQFTTFYGLQFFVNPSNTPSLGIESANFNQNDGFQFYWYWATYPSAFGTYIDDYGATFPWYYPSGTYLNFSSGYFGSNYYYGNSFVGYWTGTGAGSYNGASPTLPLRIDGPINETAWMATFGIYNESVAAPTLTSASSYAFTMNGATYSGTGGSNVVVPDLGTGAYPIGNISATGAPVGWSYFGYPDGGNPVIVPNVPTVNLSFADVDLASAAGNVSFHAQGLPANSSWTISFNGTEHSSLSPWINVTTHTGDFPVESFPTVSSAGNESFVPNGIGSAGDVVVGQTYDVNFTAAYEVQLEASGGGSLSERPGNYFLTPGATLKVNETPSTGFVFGGWDGTGAGSYTGNSSEAVISANAPVTEAATFIPIVPNRFNVTVDESGVPNGTEWSVLIGGVGYSSTTDQLVVPNEYSCTFSGSLGKYALAVPFTHTNGSGLRYLPTSAPQTVCGGGAAATVDFSTEYSVTVTAQVGGTVQVTVSAGGSTASPYWVPSGGLMTIFATALAGYTFVGWSGSGSGGYSGPLAQPGGIDVLGPISEIAEFAPVAPSAPVRYTATFVESPTLVQGTIWTLSNLSASLSSTTNEIVVSGLAPGSYTFGVATSVSPDGQTRYVPATATITADISHANESYGVSFSTEYWVAISSVGPGTAAPSSRWVSAGALLSLSAAPSGAAEFLGWAGLGNGSYSGAAENSSISVHGPISEVASFALPVSSVSKTTNSSPSVWSNPLLWAALGILGLVIGVALGAMMARGRRPPMAESGGTETTTGPDPGPEDVSQAPDGSVEGVRE
jgi:Divergent InlB B-repeat domain